MLWAPFSESAAFFSIVVDQYQKYLLSVPGLQLHPSSQGIKWPHFDKSRQVGLGLRIRVPETLELYSLNPASLTGRMQLALGALPRPAHSMLRLDSLGGRRARSRPCRPPKQLERLLSQLLPFGHARLLQSPDIRLKSHLVLAVCSRSQPWDARNPFSKEPLKARFARFVLPNHATHNCEQTSPPT